MPFPEKTEGLRERKKEQTRELIADTAWRLFADRGFDEVTVTEIARESMVSVATVFNYFPTKEDLFYFRLESFGEQLVQAVSDRAPGEPVITGFRRGLLKAGGLLSKVDAGDKRALDRLRTVHRMIAASPALQAREQRALAANAQALAESLARDAGVSSRGVQPSVAANALIGVQRALIDLVRRRVLADDRLDRLSADVRSQGEKAFELLAGGLGEYARKPKCS